MLMLFCLEGVIQIMVIICRFQIGAQALDVSAKHKTESGTQGHYRQIHECEI